MAIELRSVVVRVPDLMAERVDEDLVVLNLASDSYVALDAIGRRVWEAIESAWVVEELCARLSREFAATPEQIAADVLPFLEELAAEKMLQVLDAPPA